MIETIKKLSVELYEEIRAVRQHIHKHPELSFQEKKTSLFIQEKLKEAGIAYKANIVDTGIVGVIEGKSTDGRIVALRADMDALPVKEKNKLSYKSVHEGVMHACGHDVHMACLLGAARILNGLKSEFHGKIILVFQPGEEKYPGGGYLMLKEGLFGDDVPDVVLAQHVDPFIDAGKIGLRPGKYMASADEVYITIKGQGGHAAMPERVKNTVLAASKTIIELQQVKGKAPESIPTVLSFGKVNANGATNILPDKVEIEGTFRTMDDVWREEAHQLIRQIVKNTVESEGLNAEVKISKGYPCLVNDLKVTEYAKLFGCDYLGNNNVQDVDIQMLAEDFAYFSRAYPALMYRLGVKDKNNEAKNLHSPDFEVKEEVIRTGMGLMAYLAMSFLNEY